MVLGPISKAHTVSIMDLETGARYRSSTEAAARLGVTVEEVHGLLACGWLVQLRPPPLLLPKGVLKPQLR